MVSEKYPLRVLHVLGRLDRGGAETMVMNLYRKIDRSLIQFDFVKHTEDSCEFDEEILSLGGRIISIPQFKGYNFLHYINSWRKLFKVHSEYKIIHGHVRSTASIYLWIAKRYRLITVAHSHSTSSGNGFKAFVKNILQYPIRNNADYFFACSRKAGLWLFGKRVVQGNNFTILNNAIDTQRYTFDSQVRYHLREKLHIENKFVIGHVGRFTAAKNHNFLIDIFKLINDKYANTFLLLVGDGDLRTQLERKVRDLGLTHCVSFLGVRADIPDIMQAMDVFLFPSLVEGLGIVAIEAQAAGLPSIVSDALPEEVIVSNLIQRVSLNTLINHWVDLVLGHYFNPKERKNTSEEINKNGYNIIETSDWLREFYLKLAGNQNV